VGSALNFCNSDWADANGCPAARNDTANTILVRSCIPPHPKLIQATSVQFFEQQTRSIQIRFIRLASIRRPFHSVEQHKRAVPGENEKSRNVIELHGGGIRAEPVQEKQSGTADLGVSLVPGFHHRPRVSALLQHEYHA
jgi:hypothetical protein